ncbi:MAG: cytochrome C biogenesis protein [Candidatus Omnitrophica bacterium]|nr:cytochrome C biogenesis protein [Candidatus Omnitrophota bacterium]
MQNIFAFLTQAVEGNPVISIVASFLWGILSIILSPCHLVSIPLIVGFITQQGVSSTNKALKLSLIFSLGIFLTIAIVGIITSFLGRMAGDIGKLGNYIVASVLLILGLYLLDLIKIPGFKGINQPVLKQKSDIFTAFLLGLIFGIAIGPCTFAYMAPILAVIFKVSGTQFLYGILLILIYAAGHCSVIVIAGTSVEFVEKCVKINERSRVGIIKKICGLLVILAGLYMFWSI